MNDQRKTKKALIQELNSLEYAESIINTVREPLIVLWIMISGWSPPAVPFMTSSR
jgi:hypothetical protein